MLGLTEAGTYVISEMPSFTFTYTGTATRIKKIDLKYISLSNTTTIINETINVADNQMVFSTPFTMNAGQTYTVEFDGVRYSCTGILIQEMNVVYIGNLYLMLPSPDINTYEPFMVYTSTDGSGSAILCKTNGAHKLKIYTGEYVQIPKECLLEIMPVVTAKDDGAILIAKNGAWIAHSHAFMNWIEIKAPTDTDGGLKYRSCSECNHTEIVPIFIYGTILSDNRSLFGYTGEEGENLVILESYRDHDTVYKAKAIGDYAFSRCSNLTSITIPDSVTSIGCASFGSCAGLTSMTVSDGNTTYHSAGNCIIKSKTLVAGCQTSVIPSDGSVTIIDWYAFSGCTGLTSITIPDSITSIGSFAFNRCTSLTSITIPNSVKSIGNDTFSGCTGLTSITIPNSVTSMGNGTFNGCSGLTSVIIGDGVTSIGHATFARCTSLTNIAVPASVTSIDGYAFNGCTSLTSITIPDSVVGIGTHAFNDCTGLADVYYTGTEEQWAAISIDEYNSNLINATIHYNYTESET